MHCFLIAVQVVTGSKRANKYWLLFLIDSEWNEFGSHTSTRVFGLCFVILCVGSDVLALFTSSSRLGNNPEGCCYVLQDSCGFFLRVAWALCAQSLVIVMHTWNNDRLLDSVLIITPGLV